MKTKKSIRVAVVSHGWLGDSLICTAAASSLFEEYGYEVDFFCKWRQLAEILKDDTRFRTFTYKDSKIGNFFLNRRLREYSKIIYEPFPWSHNEPLTTEIRRIAGCQLKSEFYIQVNPQYSRKNTIKDVVVMSRDLYSRNFNRDVDEFVGLLSEKYKIEWIGLKPGKSSKRGRNKSLIPAVKKLSHAKIFIGPEGGLLWLSAALNVPCVYFSENIDHIHKVHKSNTWEALGSEVIYPNGNHKCLPPYCSNQDAIKLTLGHLKYLGY